MRVVLGEITNTVGKQRLEASSFSKKASPLPPRSVEVQALVDCARRLREVWAQTRARNSCGYLFRHFAKQAAMHPSGELPSYEELLAAWTEEDSEEEEEETPKQERIPALGGIRGGDDFAIFQDEDDLPEKLGDLQLSPASSAGSAAPAEICGGGFVWESPECSPKSGESPWSSSEGGRGAAATNTFAWDCGHSEDEAPIWNDKELCEKELENRMLSMLQQEQEESFLLEQETSAMLELAQSLNAGQGSSACTPDSTPTRSKSLYCTPPRRRSRGNPALEAASTTELPSNSIDKRPAEVHTPSDIGVAAVEIPKELLRVLHQAAERHRPSARSVLAHIGAEERVLVVDWVLQTSYAMNFTEVAAFGAVSCLDRFLSSLTSPLPVEEIQVSVLATVSIALKLHGMSQVPVSLREVLAHLGQGSISVERILLQEQQVLESLDFQVATPTAIEMLGLIANRCQVRAPQDPCCQFCGTCREESVWQLAEFLLHMALREVQMLYAYPSSLLAIAAVLLAWGSVAAKPCPTQLRVLLRCLRTTVQSVLGPASAPAVGTQMLDGRFHHCI